MSIFAIGTWNVTIKFFPWYSWVYAEILTMSLSSFCDNLSWKQHVCLVSGAVQPSCVILEQVSWSCRSLQPRRGVPSGSAVLSLTKLNVPGFKLLIFQIYNLIGRWVMRTMISEALMPELLPPSPCSALLCAREDLSWSRWVEHILRKF